MTRQTLSRVASQASRALRSSNASSASRIAPPRFALVTPLVSRAALVAAARSRAFSSSPTSAKGILPHSDDPAPPNVLESETKAVPAELTDAEYHEVADAYLDVILSRLEEIAEKDEGIDVEYSVRTDRGILTPDLVSILHRTSCSANALAPKSIVEIDIMPLKLRLAS